MGLSRIFGFSPILALKMGSWSQVLTVRKLAGLFLSKFQVVLGQFEVFSIFSTRFTVKQAQIVTGKRPK